MFCRISSRDQFRIHAQCWALLIGGPCTGEYRLFLHEVETYLALCRVRIPTVPPSHGPVLWDSTDDACLLPGRGERPILRVIWLEDIASCFRIG